MLGGVVQSCVVLVTVSVAEIRIQVLPELGRTLEHLWRRINKHIRNLNIEQCQVHSEKMMQLVSKKKFINFIGIHIKILPSPKELLKKQIR